MGQAMNVSLIRRCYVVAPIVLMYNLWPDYIPQTVHVYLKVQDGCLISVQLYVISEYATQWRDEPSSDDGEATSRCPPDDGTGAHGAFV